MHRRKKIFVIIAIVLVVVIGYGYSVSSSKEKECSSGGVLVEDGDMSRNLIENTSNIALLNVNFSCTEDDESLNGKVHVFILDGSFNEIKSFTVEGGESVSKWVLVTTGENFYVEMESDNFIGKYENDNYSYVIVK